MPHTHGKRPKLLIVGAFPPEGSNIIGGIATVCRALVSTSFRDEFDLILVDSTQASNPPPGFAKRARLALERFIGYCKTLFRERPDGVLLFAAIGASLIEKATMASIARTAGIPVALFPRGGAVMDMVINRALGSSIYSAALKTGDRFLCQGPKWQQFATTNLGYLPEHAPIIENWSASAELLAIGANRAAGTSPRCHLVFVGWLEREKGVGELLVACGRLASRFDFVLTFAGDGHFAYEARQLIDQVGLTGRVVLKGWVNPGDVPALLAAADVFVLPSYAEGLPNAMIEAMAAGLPSIVTTVGTIPHVITHRKNGLLIAPRDVEALETALAALLSDSKLRSELGANAHLSAATLFSVDPAMRKLASELNKMIAEKSRRQLNRID